VEEEGNADLEVHERVVGNNDKQEFDKINEENCE